MGRHKDRVCSLCHTPIDSGFVCRACKRKKYKDAHLRAQRNYLARKRGERAAILAENAALKEEIKKLQEGMTTQEETDDK